jgi:large subunit ribosomal protein L13e
MIGFVLIDWPRRFCPRPDSCRVSFLRIVPFEFLLGALLLSKGTTNSHGKNNVLQRNHFHKDWQRRVKTWFDQPGAKKRRRTARQKKATSLGVRCVGHCHSLFLSLLTFKDPLLRPVDPLRPAVRCPTIRYNRRLRAGRGFTLEELKAAGIKRREARSVGITVDHRRRNRSEESLKLNVDRLNAYKQRLIVFPLKKGKAKNGDSTVR